jgi:uncharacterized damage-inducible protein DinB
MSVFTNPADGAKGSAEAYITAVLGLVGNQDPLAILEATGPDMRAAVAGLDAGELRTAETEGKWSMVQVLQHMADSEVVWGWRLRKAWTEPGSELTGYDQDAWASGLHYEDADADAALAAFEALRRIHLDLLRNATEEELTRYAVHAERGKESVAHMVRLYAGHDMVHRNQLRRIRGVLRPEEGTAREYSGDR